jgi:hypothetical protein
MTGCENLPPDDCAPRSMRDPVARARRRALLDLSHMKPLVRYVGELRTRDGVEVPDFDPCDGGVKARVLFLLEKPGPMTSENRIRGRSGSGFISRNNDDLTAEATFNFMQAAGIPRELTILWNVVPWWNGTRKVTHTERIEGVNSILQLVELLPKLSTIVLVGKKAATARQLLHETNFNLLESSHPSPLVRARWPERWNAIPQEWSKVMPL